MDDKARRRDRVAGYQRRLGQNKQHGRAQSYGRKIWKLLKDYKNTVFTCSLLLILVVLLFAVFSEFQPPAPASSVPSGETAIDYSTFVKQVTSGNVLAVILRGNEINGLLINSLSQSNKASITPSSQSLDADYTAWSRYVGSGNMTLASATPAASVSSDRAIYTQTPIGGESQLMTLLMNNHVKVSTLPAAQTPALLTYLWRFLPIILVIIMMCVLIFSRNGSHSMRSFDERITQIGKNRARRFERLKENDSRSTPIKPTVTAHKSPVTASAKPSGASHRSTEPPVTFDDVAGIDEVRAELEEIVQFLRSLERFDRLGARIPCGALLVGPPGTGKTLLAKAVAGEAHVPFFSMSASEFVEMFVGVGASRVRDLFNQARQAAPAVIFIDELDAVGRKRTMRVAGNDERDQTLNQLLVELDGFDTRKAVVVIAATNRVDILDKALLRPGRFDRRITVSPPDRAGREAILKIHTRKTPLHEDVELERLARMTTGMTGADLANLVNEAALSAARQNLEHVSHECFEQALARVQLGALRPIVMGDKDRRIIAVHEAGHALVAHHLPAADTVNRVTILPRGQSLGVTQFTSEEDRYNYSRETLMARIAVGLGGRVAEDITFGSDQVTTGAENDLQVVTDLARRMVTRWGMSEQLGVVFADYRAEGDYSLNLRRIDPDAVRSRSLALDANGQPVMNGNVPEIQPTFAMSVPNHRQPGGAMLNAQIDAEVQRILNEGRAIARRVLTEHNDQLTLLADTLIEREQLDRAQFEALLQKA